MPRHRILLIIKFAVALCSIAYELVLAQALSAFLSNTVLRYCVTIGLYMLFMGLGAFFVERKLSKTPWMTFWRTEIALTVLGALSLPSLFAVDALRWGDPVFLAWSHILICVIGFLTGFELPLALELARRDTRPGRNALIASDYLGAFVGTVVFALVFYPRLGLMASVWCVSLVNAVASFGLVRTWRKEFDVAARTGTLVSLAIILICAIGIATAGWQEQFLVGFYLR
jgi:spermidine synthase